MNAASLFVLALWLVAVSVPAPRPTLPPYEQPSPAYVCGSASPFREGEEDVWNFQLTIDRESPSIHGQASRADGTRFEVRPEQCRYEGRFECALAPGEPELWVQPTIQRDGGMETSDDLARTNAVAVSFREESGGAFSETLPYARSCRDQDVNRARQEQDDRFTTRLLLREAFRSVFGD